MRSVRIRGIIGSIYLTIYYLTDTIYSLNAILGKEYFFLSLIIQLIGMILYLSALSSIIKSYKIRKVTIVINILIATLLFCLIYRILCFYINLLPWAIESWAECISGILSIVLCIRILSIDNNNLQYINKIKTLSIIYLSVSALLTTLAIFKVSHLMMFPRNLMFIFLVVPYIYSLFLFRKIQIDLNVENNTSQIIEVDTLEKI